MQARSMLTKQLSPFFAFFVVTVMQIGVGIFTFQRTIVSIVGHDGWIAIILSALMVHVVIWILYKMLNQYQTIVDVQKGVFGKGLGTFVSLYWILYYSLFVLTLLIGYTEILRTWLFPEVANGVLFFVLLFLAYLFTMSGLRTIVGISVLAVLMGLPIFFLSRFPYGQMQFRSLFPVWDHSFLDLWSAIGLMTFQYLGFEILLMAYPFIREAPRSHKWAQLGVTFSMITYLIGFILPVLYFHENHLAVITWPTLSFWRMEYFGMSIWIILLLPNMALGLWAASRVAKQTLKISQRHAVWGLSPLIFGCAFLFTDQWEIEAISSFTSSLGFFTIFVYLPLLFLIQTMITKRRRRQ
ncbi:hypothetical protein HNR44_002946 [Geomicrobium halophilum]|uniref:Spore germination protein (Amino acid permease) n=1 Tax=Geomicrobium halophilum TaxID=549000 RepID=A0A841PUZ0_9BACL|nr:GerAB/ArcD/ProY family transporter [Geomicrobium halophilum]MBB6450956.1 hypothetical protein [Geomicrobium halophilum]